MATLLKDDAGIPIPQYMNGYNSFEAMRGIDGAIYAYVAQLDTTNTSLTVIKNRLTETNDMLAEMTKPTGNTIFQSMQSMLSSIKAAVDALKTVADDLKDAVDSLNTTASSIKDDVAVIKLQATQTNTNTTMLPSNLTAINETLVNIKSDTLTIASNTSNTDETGGAS